MKNLKNRLKISGSLYDYYIQTLIILGIPAIAFLYLDYKAAFTAFVITNIVLGILAIKGDR